MKKHILPILVLPLLLLTSCNETITPFYLSPEFYTAKGEGALVDTDFVTSVVTKREEKASFAFVVNNPGCGVCTAFVQLVRDYVSAKDLKFYSVPISEMKVYDNDLYKKIRTAPSFVIYKEGEFCTYLNSDSNEHIQNFKSLSGFTEWFETYVIVTPPPTVAVAE